MTARQFVYCLLCLVWVQTSTAQLVINNTYTPTQLVQNFLIGNGVTVSNVTINGGSDPRQFGYFTNANSNLPINSGIVMMTGYTDDLNGIPTNIDDGFTSNNPNPPANCSGGICGPNDVDLDAIVSPSGTFDAAVLEFDFVPIADTIRFRYTFGSEEYNEYVCSDFNDVFAFFISGPGFGAPTNLAIIPGSNPPLPVSINNVNNGTVGTFGNPANCTATQLANSGLFIDNASGAHVQFDGMTVALEAWAVVQPCSTYHIKLAIADVFDGSLDSGIFLEAGSFSSNGLVVQSVTANGDSIITEQCNTGEINFTFDTPVSSDTTFFFSIGGTASNGVDYQFIPDSINISAGDSSAIINIIPITDNIIEGLETITISIQTNICSADTITLFIGEEVPPPAPDSLTCYTIQDSTIAFTWASVPNVSGYQVSLDSGATWITPNNGSFSHLFNNIPPNTFVNLWVSSIDSTLICTMPLSDSLTCMDCGLIVDIDSITAACENTMNGAVDLSIGVGTAPYSYQWSTGATTQDLNNIAAGSYALSVTDGNGCMTVVPTVRVDTLLFPNITPTVTDLSCDSLGSITLQVSGNTAPYNFSWNTGATTQDINNLAMGAYVVTVSGTVGCSSTLTIPVDSSGAPIVTLDTIIGQDCFALGSIDINTVGGVMPYTYNWSNNETTEDIAGLTAGNYSVTVTGANNCSVTLSFVVTSINPPIITIDSIQHQNCFGLGSILTTTTDGTTPYTFLWNTGATTDDITGISEGIYSITVTDANNCTTTIGNIQVDSTGAPSITINTVTPQGCSALGSIDLSTSGGTAPLSFSWSNNSTTQNITGLTAGNYSLTITDANNCAIDTTITVSQNPLINLSIDTSNALLDCDLQPIGQLNAIATGGVGTLSYTWSNAVNTANNTNLAAGTYIVTVTDGDCEVIDTATVLAPIAPNLNAFIGQAPIIDSSIYLNQSITVNANNSSTGNFTYMWSANNSDAGIINPNNMATVVTPTAAGQYTYTVNVSATTNGITCSAVGTVTLTVNEEDFKGVPNAFSPNGDNVNDYMKPIELNTAFIKRFEIYNRWSQLIYNDPTLSGNVGWDGRFNGVAQPQDVYLYILEYQIPGEELVKIRGEFTLLR